MRADRGRGHCHHRSAPFRRRRKIARLSERDRRRAADSLRRRLLLLHAARDGDGRHRHRDRTRALRCSGADSNRRNRGRPYHRLAWRFSRRWRQCAGLRRSGIARRRIAPGLAALEHGAWDAVVDTSGYVPRIVDASASLLAGRATRYLFVSSISVYASASLPGQDEGAPVLLSVDRNNEDIPKNYGALKASCESVVAQYFAAAATTVRPGLIVGPFDPTDRFAYWDD